MEDTLDAVLGALDFAALFAFQKVPLLPHALQPELLRDIQHAAKTWPQQCRADMQRVIGIRIRPYKSRMLSPKATLRASHSSP